MPGVFICVKGDSIGEILDKRDPATCPSLKNLKKKNCNELKGLLLEALNKQREQLVEHEGEGTSIEKGIQKEITWASKVNVEKAEKEAKKHR
mmetsp:Transcript_87697/g.249505  ORF Transcript_87697/g.249505 Transcript_87697/m.249505 type:complete len:92 (+) Transcript_87697:309-584(+)